MTDRDPHRVEHEQDPPDKADAYVELTDDGYLHDAATREGDGFDDWTDEPLTSPFRNYRDQPARPPYKDNL
jgi:hypothetical protein